MQDWVNLLTAGIQLLAAIIIYKAAGRDNKKGTKKRSPRGKRK